MRRSVVTRARRMRVERLEHRRVLAVEAFSYVDANDDGAYDAADGDIVLDDELADGKFDTAVPEGDYTAIIPGAGLVISGTAIDTENSFKLRAYGDITINTDITAEDDIDFVSYAGSVFLDDPTLESTDGNVEITAALDIMSTDDVIIADEEVDLEAGRNIYLVGTPVTAGERVEIEAGNVIRVYDSDSNQAVIQAEDVDLEGSTITLTDPVDLNTGLAAEIIATGESLEVEAINTIRAFGVTLTAEEGSITIDATNVNINDSTITAYEEIDIEADANLVANRATVTAQGDDEAAVEMEADGELRIVDAVITAQEYLDLEGDLMVLANRAIIQALGDDGRVEIESDDGDVSLIDAVVRAWDEIDIEADTTLDLTRASIGILTGSSSGDIEIEADTATLTDAVIAAAGDIDLDIDTEIGIPTTLDEDLTLPAV